MRILAIESSCDETSAAIVEDGRKLLANIIASQADLHSQFGGVVPEIAAREHIKAIVPVVDAALAEAGLEMSDIDALAVTAGPGLAGALLVGVNAAKALAFAYNKPLYAVHHLAGHIAANFIADAKFNVPYTGLIVSGGHSHLVKMDEQYDFTILGRTLDDACGEAFDKIARALGLGYPGGPKIDKTAQKGDATKYVFPTSKLQNPLDFSFSGLKTAALTYINKAKMAAKLKNCDWQDFINVADFCASFQAAIIDTLVKHSKLAIEQTNCRRFALAGGVAANSALRTALKKMCDELQVEFYCPDLVLCTDNAAMIAAAAYCLYLAEVETAKFNLNAFPTWSLDSWKITPKLYVKKKI